METPQTGPGQCSALALTSPQNSLALAEDVAPAVLPAVAIAELAAALTLCAPAGMTLEAREEWLRVAYMTLADVPEDLFIDAARAARLSCKHPAQVVPSIAAHVAERQALRQRVREMHALAVRAEMADSAPRAIWRPTPEELAEVKREVQAAMSTRP